MNPEILGRYRISDLLEETPLGACYLGVDPILGRKVLIQTVRLDLPAFSESEFAEKYDKELAAAQRLSHPHIATVFDCGRDGSVAYLASEYLDGRDLRLLIVKDKPLPVELATEVAASIADALAYAHRHGVLHKGVSPENIVVLANGKVKLTGFGMAALKAAMPPTSPLAGTPAYMAPEQFSGKPIDTRTDIFSLAVVFYQLLTGKAPFEADTPAEVMYRIVRKPARTPSRLASLGHRGFDVILAKALAKAPENRYQTANELAADLRQAEQLARNTPLAWPQGGLSPRKQRGSSGSRGGSADPARRGTHLLRHWLPVSLAVAAAILLVGSYAIQHRPPQPAATAVNVAVSSPEAVKETSSPTEPAVTPDSPPPRAPAEPVMPTTELVMPPTVAEPPSADVAATPTAIVTLAIAPWGEVFVDGKSRGVSPPLMRLELPAGKVRVEVRNSGAPALIKELTLSGGETVRIKHKF